LSSETEGAVGVSFFCFLLMLAVDCKK